MRLISRNGHKGASLTGYGLVVGLISIVALSALTSTGTQVNSLFFRTSDALVGIVPSADPQASASASASPYTGATTFNFTTCGATGGFGPSQSNCNTAYSSTDLNGLVTVTSGMQDFIIPATGQWRITAIGAAGATNGSNVTNFGHGARMIGTITLTMGDELRILVGQKGQKSPSANSSAGGGGSYVVQKVSSGDVMFDSTQVTPLVIAGGGGGVGGSGSASGVNATTTETSSNDSRGTATPTTGGQGGQTSPNPSNTSGGGGGGGYYSDASPKEGNSGSPGQGFLNGGTGGLSRDSNNRGGFGGGGGNHESSGGGGGGGGYSGAPGGALDGSYAGGGGGGSFNADSGGSGSSNIGTNDGSVTLKYLGP